MPDFSALAGFPMNSVQTRGSVSVALWAETGTGGGTTPLLIPGRIYTVAEVDRVFPF